ncbi:MAG: hypothetical protein J0H61_11500 [Alphaproteobacteria bacterium]|nr:hypothetical protein [Alphaproteobacteria bacterium]
MSFLEHFLAGDIPAADFHHAHHVRAGYELLREHDFLDAATAYCGALKEMTARVGKPEIFHQTMTLAFLALIAERMERASAQDFQTFAAANPDLMDKRVLARWYGPDKLKTPLARRGFVLPDPAF